MAAQDHNRLIGRAGLGAAVALFLLFQVPLSMQMGANAEEAAPLLRHPPPRLAPGGDEHLIEPGLRQSEGLPVWAYVWQDGSMTPLMVDGHVGALSFVAARLLAGWGGLTAARLHSTLLGLLGLLAIFAFARRLGGEHVGWLAAVFAAISSQYAFVYLMVRPDEQLDSLAHLVALLAFVRHHDTRRLRWFYVGCLLVGVGLMAKNTAIWPLMGMAVGALAFRLVPRVGRRQWALGTILAGLPLLPQLAYVALSEGGGAFSGRLNQISAPWVGLAPENLGFSLMHFDQAFGHMGTTLAEYARGRADSPLLPGAGYVILFAVLLVVASAFDGRQAAPVRAFGAGLGVTLLLYWMLYYRGASYYMLLAPWVPVAMALCVVGVWNVAPGRARRAALLAAVLFVVVSSGAEATRMWSAVRAPEAAMFDGGAQREAAEVLIRSGRTAPYVTTYGAVGVYELHSRGEVRPRVLWPYFDLPGGEAGDFQTAWVAVFSRLGPGRHTLLLSPDPSPVETSEGVPGHLIASELPAAAAAAGVRLEWISTQRSPSNQPIIQIVELQM